MTRPVWLDQALASDPALTRLVSAVATTVSMGLAFLAEWQFVDLFDPLGSSSYLSARDSAAALALHHEVTIVAMLIGGLLALMLGLTFDETDFRGAAIATVLPTIPLLTATLIALLLGSNKWIILSINPLLLGAGTLFRRYGTRGNNVGTMMYLGGFLGYFLSSQFGIRALGWLAAEVLVAVVVIFIVRIPLIIFQARSNLERAMQSYTIRARLLTQLAVKVLQDANEKSSDNLRVALIRLNEMALIIEAYMSRFKSVPAIEEMRQTLFDLELSLSNLARFSDSLSRLRLSSLISRDIVDYIQLIPDADPGQLASDLIQSLTRWQSFSPSSDSVTPILLRRLSTSIINLNSAALRWREVRETLNVSKKDLPAKVRHTSSLRTGHLPGSAVVSASASNEPWDHETGSYIGLTPEVRSAIQITIATAAATWIGYFVDPQRYYWASLSAFLCFIGVNNAGEQVRKGLYRFLGTVLGVAIGSALAKAFGLNSTLDAITVLVAMFFGVYLSKVNYSFLAMGVTVAISMVFLQLSELSNSLLLERILETAVGALLASITALFILPLSPRRVIATARARFLDHLQQLLTMAVTYLKDPDLENELVGLSREVDADFHALVATVSPLQWSLLGGLNREVNELISRVSAVRNYSRSFVADLREPSSISTGAAESLVSVVQRMNFSLNSLTRRNIEHSSPYVRVSSFIEAAKTELGLLATPLAMNKIDLLMRDLILLDGSLAALAKALKVQVTSLDTATIEGSLIS
ncbi:MAG: FUSC family protein [Actinomycetota bacterium]|nr:MAG: FUSC family protein [Actinomycetota bacterium]